MEDNIGYDVDLYERSGVSAIDFTPRREKLTYRNRYGTLIQRTVNVGPQTPLKKALYELSKQLMDMGIAGLDEPINAQKAAQGYRNLPDLVHYNMRLLAAAILIIDYRAGITTTDVNQMMALSDFNPKMWSTYVQIIKPKIISLYKGADAEVRLEADLYRYVTIIRDFIGEN